MPIASIPTSKAPTPIDLEQAANTPLPASPSPSRRTSMSSGSLAGLSTRSQERRASVSEGVAPDSRASTSPSLARRASLPLNLPAGAVMSEVAATAATPLPGSAPGSRRVSVSMKAPENLAGSLAEAQAAGSLRELHAVMNAVQPSGTPAFEALSAAVGSKMALRMQHEVMAMPESERAAEVQRCLTDFARMEPVALRANLYSMAAHMTHHIGPDQYQTVFDTVLGKTKELPTEERGPAVKALTTVAVPPMFQGSDQEHRQMTANFGKVLEIARGKNTSGDEKAGKLREQAKALGESSIVLETHQDIFASTLKETEDWPKEMQGEVLVALMGNVAMPNGQANEGLRANESAANNIAALIGRAKDLPEPSQSILMTSGRLQTNELANPGWQIAMNAFAKHIEFVSNS